MARFKSIDDEVREEIREYQDIGAQALGVALTDDPKHIVTVLNEWIRQCKQENKMPDEDTIAALGVLLSEQYVRAFGWHWGSVIWHTSSGEPISDQDEWDDEEAQLGVLSPDKALYVNGMWWVNEVFTDDSAINFLLSFNLVAAGNGPKANPGDAIGIH